MGTQGWGSSGSPCQGTRPDELQAGRRDEKPHPQQSDRWAGPGAGIWLLSRVRPSAIRTDEINHCPGGALSSPNLRRRPRLDSHFERRRHFGRRALSPTRGSTTGPRTLGCLDAGLLQARAPAPWTCLSWSRLPCTCQRRLRGRRGGLAQPLQSEGLRSKLTRCSRRPGTL